MKSISFSDLENWQAATSDELWMGFCGMYLKHGELYPLTSSYFIFINGSVFTALGVNRSKRNF